MAYWVASRANSRTLSFFHPKPVSIRESLEGASIRIFGTPCFQSEVDIALRNGVIGTFNRETGETFALLVLSRADVSGLAVQKHSALIRIVYPSFPEEKTSCTYHSAYYFGKAGKGEVAKMFANMKPTE